MATPQAERRRLIPGVDFSADMAIERGNGWACRRCNMLVCGPTCQRCGADEAHGLQMRNLLRLWTASALLALSGVLSSAGWACHRAALRVKGAAPLPLFEGRNRR